MRDAEVKIPIADETWFAQLMAQNGWDWKWLTDQVPDFQEDPE